MKIALLGATRGMGRALARELAGRGDALFLFGRDPDDLARSAADLEVRGNLASGAERSVGTAVCDLERPEEFDDALAAAEAALGGLDAVVITAGQFARQEELEGDRERLAALLRTNFTHTVLFCEAARARLLAARERGGAAVLCAFSSVAGDQVRQPVAFYGAAKAGLTHYLEGLGLRFRDRGLRVVLVKPGFVRTTMTEGLPEPPFTGEPEEVARRVADALERAAKGRQGTGAVYAPAPWRWVMLVVRRLPRWVRRRFPF